MKRKATIRRRGYIFLIAMVGLVSLFILGMTSVEMAGNSLGEADRGRNGSESLTAAEGAFDLGEAWLRSQSTAPQASISYYPSTSTPSNVSTWATLGTTAKWCATIQPETNPTTPWINYYMVTGYGYSIRSGRQSSVVGQLAPESFSLFGYFEDTGLSNNWWVSGISSFTGPFHTNNQMQIDWIKTATPTPIVFNGPAESVKTTVKWYSSSPSSSSDWLTLLAGGQSAMSLGVDSIPFPTTASEQQDAAWGATSGFPDPTVPANAGVQLQNPVTNGGLYVVAGYNPDDPTWVKSTSYALGARVAPSTPNGFSYVCTTAGTSSGTIAPVWPTTLGSTVTDNTVTWTCEAATSPSRSSWAASKTYTAGTQIWPTTPNGYTYVCTTAGTSSSSQPTWPTTVGSTVTDNAAKWTCEASSTTSSWGVSTSYVAGDRVWPTTPNGHTYVCTAAGKSSSTQPTWPTTTGGTVADGTATWQDTSPTPPWKANMAVAVGDKIHPSAGTGIYLMCTAAGTTSTTEPTWPAEGSGSTKTDNTVTWKEVTQTANPAISFSVGSNSQQVITISTPIFDSTNKDWYAATSQTTVDLTNNQTTQQVAYRGNTLPSGTVYAGVPVGVIYSTNSVVNVNGTLANNYVVNNAIVRSNYWTLCTDYSSTGQKNITISDNLTYQSQPNSSLPTTDPTNLIVPAFGAVAWQVELYNPVLPWVKSRAYNLGDRITPSTSNGYYYQCTTAGTTGTSTPTFSTTAGTVITDGTVKWTTVADNLTVDGVLMGSSTSSNGSVYVEDVYTQKLRGNLYILGGTIVETAAILGEFSGTSTIYGYNENYSYDQRMANGPLTAFPSTNEFIIVSWQCFF